MYHQAVPRSIHRGIYFQVLACGGLKRSGESRKMNDLTQGSVTKHILQLSAFLAVTLIFQTLDYLVDLYFVSRVGKEAVAGVGLAGNLMLVVVALTQMLGVGTTTLISHTADQNDQRRALLVFNQSLVLTLLFPSLLVV